MRVLVLGEVCLDAGDRVVGLPGSRQRALLGALAARRNQVVSVDRLIDLLWGEHPPGNPAAALHSVVFKLRATLAAAGAGTGSGAEAGEVLVTRDPGYVLRLASTDLDAAVFERAVEDARDQEPAEAAASLAAALGLWRGPAFGDLAETEVAFGEAPRLEELRRVATERYAAALVACDRAEDAVLVLQPFLAAHPLRDAARVVLMRALHRVGRTADGLEQFREHRRRLAEELGLEPSPALQQAQAELLQSPRSDDRPEASTPSATRPATRPPHGLQGLRVRYLRTDAGYVLAHATAGTGPPLVVVLGWISSLDVIASGRDPRSSLLERLTADLSVTLYDRAGSGLSPGPVSDYGLGASVTELLEVIRAVGPPVSVMAMSAAGPVAVTAAHRRPEWIDSLVLFGTFADARATFHDRRLREIIVEITRTHWGMGSKIFADLYRPGASDEAAWHMAKAFRDSASAEVATGYLEAIYDQDVTDLLPALDIPALVLHYRGDRLIPFGGGQELAAGLPRAAFLPLDGRVHLPDVKDVDVIQSAVVEHVHKHAGAAGQAFSTNASSANQRR